MFKWLSLKKNNLAENSWVEEESLLLDEMVKYLFYYLENMAKIIGASFPNNYSLKTPCPTKFTDAQSSADNIGTAT